MPLERQMTAGMFEMEEKFGLRMDDVRLTAMGCYLRMFSNYTRAPFPRRRFSCAARTTCRRT
ncbi:hypothetical protein NKH77_48620 [Streptomyces sp. M19]